jgi:cytoskeleton-associated protein 5
VCSILFTRSLCTCLQGASAIPKKTVRTSESMTCVSGGGLDSLPREDISGKVTPTLIKSLESPDWKVWLSMLMKSAHLL